MFVKWTIIPMARQHKAGSLRKKMCITECTIINAEEGDIHHEHEDAESEAAKELEGRFEDLRQTMPKARMAVGLTTKESLADISKWTEALSHVGNAAIFSLDARCINDEQFGWNVVTKIRQWKVDENSVYVVALPLKWYSMLMRFPIALAESSDSVDFRQYMLYGYYPGSPMPRADRIDTFRRLDQMRERLTRKLWKEPGPDKPAVSRLDIVYEGRVLKHEDFCLKCDRKVDWSLGTCVFGCYSCWLGTELLPDMMDAKDPDWRSFFGENYLDAKHAIVRDAYLPYLADQLALRNDEYTEKKLTEDGGQHAMRGLRVRLRNSLCNACTIYSDKCQPNCSTRPDKCKGPYLDTDLGDSVKLTAEPWQYHVLAMSSKSPDFTISTTQLQYVFKSMSSRSRARVWVCRPTTRELLNTARFKKDLDRSHKSVGTRVDKDWVRLVKTSYPHEALYITYGELCEALGIARIASVDDLLTEYPWMKTMQKRVDLAVQHAMKSMPFASKPVFYKMSVDTLYLYVGKQKTRVRYNLSNSGYAALEFEARGLGADRSASNRLLKMLVKGGRRMTPADVIQFIHQCQVRDPDEVFEEYHG